MLPGAELHHYIGCLLIIPCNVSNVSDDKNNKKQNKNYWYDNCLALAMTDNNLQIPNRQGILYFPQAKTISLLS